MKEKIVSTLLVLALVVATSGFSAALAQDKMAQAVPADTLFYFAGTRDSEFTQLMAPLREYGLASLLKYFDTGLDEVQAPGQALRFLHGLAQAYAERVKQDQFIPGVADEAQIAVYTVGIVPVVRIQLTDASAFKQFLDTAEKLGDVQATLGSFKDVAFRSYSIGPGETQVPAQLLVAVRPDFAVLTVDAKMFRDTTLPLALGLTAPEAALPQNDTLQSIVAKNDFNYRNLGFINHRAIVAALTGAQDSLAGQMLDTLGVSKELALLRDPACRDDVRAIFDTWPGTALGITERAVRGGTGTVNERIVSRVTDASLMDLLGNLRGHIPAALLSGERKPMFSVALALNMDNLATTAVQLQERFIQAEFQCPPLQTAQKQLQKADPSSYLIPFTAMLTGVQGVSLSVFDANPDMANFANGLDAMVVISAEHPRMVFKMAKMFAPDAAKAAHLPADGSPVELMPATDGKPAVKAMVAGPHLVLFSGAKAFEMAQNLQADELQANGILFARFDYGQLMDLVQDVLPAASALMAEGKDIVEDVQKQMEAFDDIEIRVNSLVDFVKQGVVIDVDGAVTVDAKAEADTESTAGAE